MPPPPLTPTTVTVLSVLLDAWEQKRDVDGWQLMKALHRSAPAIYAVIDRLESAGWITGEWEQLDSKGKPKPRRRFYRLTGVGVEAARAQPKPETRRRLRFLRPQWEFGGHS